MISIVCVYNNKKVFDEFLLKSLHMQSVPFELIALDNSTGTFSSAAQALNKGARQIQSGSKYIMFVHQDIDLLSASWLEDAEKLLDAQPGLGIAGVAGKSEKNQPLISNILQGTPPRHEGMRINKPVSVMTLDECCVIIPHSMFETCQFDEEICDDWHLYIVEYCLRILSLGLIVYVLPVELHHVSTGSVNYAYFKALRKVLRKHRGAYTKVHTTCGSWNTRTPYIIQWIMPIFYSITGKLIACGLVPEWMQWKKRRRLRAQRQKP
jgi:hypothetical protein